MKQTKPKLPKYQNKQSKNKKQIGEQKSLFPFLKPIVALYTAKVK